ncbi:MAG: hypothetical protein JWL65_854 [Gammaproteobacteria bacterium]|nr:hypothetical protein [Gammaproteobacteria bacterium]
MRVSAHSCAMVLCVVCILALLPAESATTNSTAMPEALIGTWRLLTIEYSGPVGPYPIRYSGPARKASSCTIAADG